jgi:hypothetical protein
MRLISACVIVLLSATAAYAETASVAVLDFRKDGVKTSSPIYYDVTDDGIKEAVDWIIPRDAFLVIDINNDGQISGGAELFSIAGQNAAYTLSTQYDTNGDSILNNEDKDWEHLYLWIDMNHDGVSQPDELRPLKTLNTTFIRLSDKIDQDLNKNYAFEYDMVFAGKPMKGILRITKLKYDPANTQNTRRGLAIGSNQVPPIRGYGQMTRLDVAAEEGIVEKSQFKTLLSAPAPELFDPAFDLHNKIERIMFEWARLPPMEPYQRGPNINPYHLAYLEAFTNKPFRQQDVRANPLMVSANIVDRAYLKAYTGTYARILMWSHAKTLLKGTPYYDPDRDEIYDATELNHSVLQSLSNKAGFMATPQLYRQY